jgi:hypothetical protein
MANFTDRSGGLSTGFFLGAEWSNPSSVLAILLIIGGEIVHHTLAQVSGSILPLVCFSFGWVSYSFNAFLGVSGDGRLMPPPDYPCKVINLRSGRAVENRSWIIGRLLRDNESYLSKKSPLTDERLRISVYEAMEQPANKPVLPQFGRLFFLSVLVIWVQVGIAVIPAVLYGDWGVALVTGVGTLLALFAGGLPQWKAEKLACRTNSPKDFAITAGTGYREVMIVRGCGRSLDLEDLAAALAPRSTGAWLTRGIFARHVKEIQFAKDTQMFPSASVRKDEYLRPRGLPVDFWLTRIFAFTSCLLWLALLVTVAGLNTNAWFLFLVGALGMLQNAYIAASSRNPRHRGIPLCHVDTITGRRVMDALMDLEVTFEQEYQGAGRNLLAEYFPLGLRPMEAAWWEGSRDDFDDMRMGKDTSRGRPRSRMPTYSPKGVYSRDTKPIIPICKIKQPPPIMQPLEKGAGKKADQWKPPPMAGDLNDEITPAPREAFRTQQDQGVIKPPENTINLSSQRYQDIKHREEALKSVLKDQEQGARSAPSPVLDEATILSPTLDPEGDHSSLATPPIQYDTAGSDDAKSSRPKASTPEIKHVGSSGRGNGGPRGISTRSLRTPEWS